MKSGNKILFLTPFLLIGLALFYLSNNQTNQIQAIYNKEEIQQLQIKEVSPTTFAFKTLDNDLIEIGTEKHSPPQPYLKINKWNGEVFLKVGIPVVTEEKPVLDGNKIRYSTVNNHQVANSSWWQKIFSRLFVSAEESQPRIDIEFYPREPEEITEEIAGQPHTFQQNEEGGVEFDTILYAKPDSNEIVFPIETKGLKFYYQPSLHPDHPTWADTNDDGIADSFRPENVVGSYAVYHETQDKFFKTEEEAEKYGVGKAFHIYRPKLTDAEKKEAWADLHIDEEKGILTIVLPQKFIDIAVYPINIDPRFGYEKIGGTITNSYGKRIHGSWFPGLSFDIIAQSLTAYLEQYSVLTPRLSFGIYERTDPTHGSLNAYTDEWILTNGWDDWKTLNIASGGSLAGNKNWLLSIWEEDTLYLRYDTGGSNQEMNEASPRTYDYPNYPSPLTFATHDYKISIYCTYKVIKTLNLYATIQSWVSFSVSPTSTALSPDMVDSTGGVHIASSLPITLTVGTNNSSGYSIDIKSLNAALCHQNGCGTAQISSASTTLSAGTDGYGAQATSTDPDVAIAASFNHATSTNTVGGLETANNDLADTTGPTLDDVTWLTLKATATSTKQSGSYQDTITLTCTGGS